ncbi:hypothetical protein [Nonomuraea sp. NPDC050691]|uniref:hypothetical protein n=1 Tax=Nonomuraea sp. NPDC050691 TaxID=3155661 RepID=UPI0033F66633
MREQRFGVIVNVSSIGGEISLPLGVWCYASKHALEALPTRCAWRSRRSGSLPDREFDALVSRSIAEGTA